MLTKKENLLETIHGGHPDRYVKQFEVFHLLMNTPDKLATTPVIQGAPPVKNRWGVTLGWPEGTPGFFPVHDAEHIVVKDIQHWREYVKAPSARFPSGMYEACLKEIEEMDGEEEMATLHLLAGFFEQCHYLCEITNALTYFYTEPESMQDLIAYLLDWEMEFADEYCTKIKPDAILHHDDWGTQISSFISPEMFEEFFLEPYKQLYGFYKSKNILIVHHADCYCANLVPYMIEMGIDIWQGAMSTNNIPELLRKYGGQISIMGGIDNGLVDRVDWTPENILNVTRKTCRECGKGYYIPCTTVGRNTSAYPGVYEAVGDAIEQVNREMWP